MPESPLYSLLRAPVWPFLATKWEGEQHSLRGVSAVESSGEGLHSLGPGPRAAGSGTGLGEGPDGTFSVRVAGLRGHAPAWRWYSPLRGLCWGNWPLIIKYWCFHIFTINYEIRLSFCGAKSFSSSLREPFGDRILNSILWRNSRDRGYHCAARLPLSLDFHLKESGRCFSFLFMFWRNARSAGNAFSLHSICMWCLERSYRLGQLFAVIFFMQDQRATKKTSLSS